MNEPLQEDLASELDTRRQRRNAAPPQAGFAAEHLAEALTDPKRLTRIWPPTLC